MPGWTGLFHAETNTYEFRPTGTFSGFSSHAKREGVEVYVQGTIYDLPPGKTAAEILATACEGKNLENLLPHLNGVFSALIWHRNELLLVTDRLGMQPIYIWENAPHFACSTELKTFLELPGFSPEMDIESLHCFLETGQLLGEKTWFRHVRLLPAATLARYAGSPLKKKQECRYWSWSAIQPVSANKEEAILETGRLLGEAVKKRSNISGRDVLLLSGGLDSRAVLAALPKETDILSLTGGEAHSPDVRIAQMASAIRNGSHQWLPLNAENWYKRRLESVWLTEGQISLLHHHFTPYRGDFAASGKTAWVGFIGDLVAGGSWIRNPEKRITKESAQQVFGKWAELSPPHDPFFDISKEDPFWIDTRCRRFTNVGTAWLECEMPVHKPFIDNELMEFIYGLPDTFRRHNCLYTSTLLRHYPSYFKKLPWQRTGFPIGYTTLTHLALAVKWPGIRRRLSWAAPFVFYRKWIRENKPLFEEWMHLLDPKNAVYPTYFNENWSEKWLLPHLSGKRDYSEEIGRALTLEFWLRCIFRKEHLFLIKS